MVNLNTYITSIRSKYQLTRIVSVGLIASFVLAVAAGLSVNYYQHQEITHLSAATRLIAVEKGLSRWKKQVSRTKLVGTKVAKANFKYKGELAYLNDLQTRFWHKIAVQSSINKALLGKETSHQLEQSVDAAIDSWHSLQLFHEALLVDEPVKQSVSKKDYLAYKKSIATLHSSLIDAIVAHRELSEAARAIQDISVIVFFVSFIVFFGLALRQYLMLSFPLFYEGLVMRRQLFNGIDSQLGMAVAQQVQQTGSPTLTHLTIGREDDGKIRLKTSSKAALQTPYVNNIDGITIVSDFSRLGNNDTDVIEADEVEDIEQKEVFLGFDQNQTYYGYVADPHYEPVADVQPIAIDIEEATIVPVDQIELEPIEPLVLDQPSSYTESGANQSKGSGQAWFEFSLPDDLLIGGNHPVWIDDAGLTSLGYNANSVNTFAKLVELFHPDERFTFLQVLRLHLQDKTGNTPMCLAARLRKANHDYAVVTISALTERASDGTALRIKGTWVDQGTSKELVNSNPVLIKSAEGLMADDLTWQMPIRFFDSENEVCNWSPSFAKALGYEPYNMPISAAQVKAIVHPEDLYNLLASINSIVKAYSMIDRFNWQVRMLHASGRYVLVMLQGVVLLDHKKQPDKLAGVMDDIDYKPTPEVKFFASYVQVQQDVAGGQSQSEDFKQRFIRQSA